MVVVSAVPMVAGARNITAAVFDCFQNATVQDFDARSTVIMKTVILLFTLFLYYNSLVSV